MRRSPYLRRSLALLLLGCAGASAGNHLVAGDTGFLCQLADGHVTGVMCDLALDVAARVDPRTTIEIVPHARLKEMMKTPRPATFYLPASAQDGARHNLQMVVQLLKDDYVVVTLSDAGVGGSSIDAAKRLRSLAVLRGSEGEKIARGMGFTNVEAKSTQAICAAMLSRRRVDGWISTWQGARFVAQGAGIDFNGLARGAKIGDANLFVLTSSATSKAEIDTWRKAFDAVRRDGTLGRIYGRYGLASAN